MCEVVKKGGRDRWKDGWIDGLTGMQSAIIVAVLVLFGPKPELGPDFFSLGFPEFFYPNFTAAKLTHWT